MNSLPFCFVGYVKAHQQSGALGLLAVCPAVQEDPGSILASKCANKITTTKLCIRYIQCILYTAPQPCQPDRLVTLSFLLDYSYCDQD